MVRSREDILNAIKERFADDTSDDYETKTNDTTDWKEKYETNDKEWREKYKARFFKPSGKQEDDEPDPDDGDEDVPMTFEELFKTN